MAIQCPGRYTMPIRKISSGIESKHPFEGETLFVKGSKSDYINASNFSEIIDLFPHNQLAEIEGSGHWVHADNPAEFIKSSGCLFYYHKKSRKYYYLRLVFSCLLILILYLLQVKT